MTKKHIVIVESTSTGLSAYIKDIEGIATTGSNLTELKNNMIEALELYYEDAPKPTNIKLEYI
jgi:predicted RNase H-like HicB family nuclease